MSFVERFSFLCGFLRMPIIDGFTVHVHAILYVCTLHYICVVCVLLGYGT